MAAADSRAPCSRGLPGVLHSGQRQRGARARERHRVGLPASGGLSLLSGFTCGQKWVSTNGRFGAQTHWKSTR